MAFLPTAKAGACCPAPQARARPRWATQRCRGQAQSCRSCHSGLCTARFPPSTYAPCLPARQCVSLPHVQSVLCLIATSANLPRGCHLSSAETIHLDAAKRYKAVVNAALGKCILMNWSVVFAAGTTTCSTLQLALSPSVCTNTARHAAAPAVQLGLEDVVVGQDDKWELDLIQGCAATLVKDSLNGGGIDVFGGQQLGRRQISCHDSLCWRIRSR